MSESSGLHLRGRRLSSIIVAANKEKIGLKWEIQTVNINIVYIYIYIYIYIYTHTYIYLLYLT